jgi:[protein-PII] uridylyltransferase
MDGLLEKIAADARARLSLPPGSTIEQEKARFRSFLRLETHRLKLAHRSGAGGLEICRARAAVVDHLIRALWDATFQTLSPQARKEFPPIALLALGGYGRGELNPHSDIDLMFLHEGQVAQHTRPLPVLERMMDGVWLTLFDLGLKPGHSVRTIAECLELANDPNEPRSMEIKTSLLEARLLAGDAKLFARFQKAFLARCVRGHEAEYIAARLQDQAARRERFGNSATMQEPHLKNGCGGLRDFQNLLWMAFFKCRVRTLRELQVRGVLTVEEQRALEAAYDFLLRVRTELHYHVNRAADTLTRHLQPTVAHNLGYTDRSPGRRIERFMRQVYLHMRNVFLITRTLEQRLALLPPENRRLSLPGLLRGRRGAASEPVDGLRFLDGEIHAASPRIFRDQPRRLMRVFLHAQQRGLRLHPDLAQLIRHQLALVDREFLHDPHVAETFLAILNQRGNVAPVLRAMHEVDLLGRYLPEFGRLTCLVQHEFYHQYTADEHTLVCLEQLDRVWEARTEPHRFYTPLLQSLDRPFLLYLALLLHDTGKAAGRGDHSELGARMARRVARRLGLDRGAVETLETLIREHLLMASVSQRRDLDDPGVIRHFAARVRTPEMLTLLTLHTFVDAQATSDKLWNGFKDALLRELYTRALPLLTGGTEYLRAEEQQREALLQEVRRRAGGRIPDDELHAHFATLPPRYYAIHSAAEILEDLDLVHEFLRLQFHGEGLALLRPVVRWRNDPDRSCTVVKVCTWDRAGLFSHIAGSLSAAGLTILSARIFTRSDDIALDTFDVADARTGHMAEAEQRQRFERLLEQLLTGQRVDLPALIARQQTLRPLYQAYTGERIPTRIRFDNDLSESRTVIEIETEDRIGLLYALAQTLTALRLDISTARICTERGAAMDSFYVQEFGGGKVTAPERQREIESALRRAMDGLDAAAKD